MTFIHEAMEKLEYKPRDLGAQVTVVGGQMPGTNVQGGTITNYYITDIKHREGQLVITNYYITDIKHREGQLVITNYYITDIKHRGTIGDHELLYH